MSLRPRFLVENLDDDTIYSKLETSGGIPCPILEMMFLIFLTQRVSNLSKGYLYVRYLLGGPYSRLKDRSRCPRVYSKIKKGVTSDIV